jgi:hypothetical protein
MNMILSEAGKKALQILKQPTAEVDSHTNYARPGTPYYEDANEHSPNKVNIVVYCDKRFSDIIGDSDLWDKSEECIIPALSFYEALSKLEAGEEVSLQAQADIVKTDIAWGVDCENPHDTITHQEMQILIQIGISKDMKTVTLKLLRREGDDFIPYAQLQQTYNARLS